MCGVLFLRFIILSLVIQPPPRFIISSVDWSVVDLLQVNHCGSMWLDLNGWFVTGESIWDRRIDVAWPEWLICSRWCIVGLEDRCGLTWMVDLFQVMHCGTGGSMWLDLNGWFVTGESLRGKKIDVAWPEWRVAAGRWSATEHVSMLWIYEF